MRTVGAVLVLGVLAWVSSSLVITRPMCDSPEVEEAATSALEYINSLHKHGYKYALNRIEEAKVISEPTGAETYFLELDLLQTMCHAMDPTPLANCTVRPKLDMTVEGDCDVAVKKLDGVLSVKAFKCKSSPDSNSREDMCLDCPKLLPLNHTDALQMVDVALKIINKKANNTSTFALHEVARLTSKMFAGGFKLAAEFVIVETNCSSGSTEWCAPLQGPGTHYAVCQASSSSSEVMCKDFQTLPAPVAPGTNDTAAAAFPIPPPHPHPVAQGHMHHKLIHLHDPSATGLLSESKESAEVPVVKREVPVDPGLLAGGPGIQLCPGRLRYF